jgi:hypothetical protein
MRQKASQERANYLCFNKIQVAMITRALFILFISVFFASCVNPSANTQQSNDDYGHGESLYAINLRIIQNDEDQQISSTVFSQELLTWKHDFIKKHGNHEWQSFRSKMIRKYGNAEKMSWFLN